MKLAEAVDVLRPAIDSVAGTWADFGAGTGVFTRALAQLLGERGKIFAIDTDAVALEALREISVTRAKAGALVLPVAGDFRDVTSIQSLAQVKLDGALFANALHFVRDPERVVKSILHLLGDSARIVIVEYDRRAASRWVPYPLSVAALTALARDAALEPPRVVSERPSTYGGVMYCAVMEHRRSATAPA